MWSKVVAFWNKLSPGTQKWLKGLEVAVGTAVVAAFVAAPASDFHTKKGITEFVAGVATAVYGAVRLYLTQSPSPLLVRQTLKETRTVGDVSHTVESDTTTSGGTPQPTSSKEILS